LVSGGKKLDIGVWFVRNDEEVGRLSVTSGLADRFAKSAPQHDEAGSFPHDNIKALQQAGYVRWTTPKAYGGEGI